MTAIFKEAGNTIKHNPGGSAVTAADVIVIDEKVCVAKHDIPANTEGELDTNGVFAFTKDGATAFAQGVKVFYDEADDEATELEDTGTNKLIGYVHKAALAADVSVECMLANDVS